MDSTVALSLNWNIILAWSLAYGLGSFLIWKREFIPNYIMKDGFNKKVMMHIAKMLFATLKRTLGTFLGGAIGGALAARSSTETYIIYAWSIGGAVSWILGWSGKEWQKQYRVITKLLPKSVRNSAYDSIFTGMLLGICGVIFSYMFVFIFSGELIEISRFVFLLIGGIFVGAIIQTVGEKIKWQELFVDDLNFGISLIQTLISSLPWALLLVIVF